MKYLGVNIDHVATLRQARKGKEPDPVSAAFICEEAGADSIVVHLREDKRHIQERDVIVLKDMVKRKFNLEMSIADDIVAFACRIRPHQVTLVPEKRKELTTEGGLDLVKNKLAVKKAVSRLRKAEIPVSAFIDPQKKQIEAALDLGISLIELHTGVYAEAKIASQQRFVQELATAASFAHDKGLTVFAGHGLNYSNIKPLLDIPEIEEFNIGYSIICRAIFVGLDQAVREMKALLH